MKYAGAIQKGLEGGRRRRSRSRRRE
jgi:hypothetical protein